MLGVALPAALLGRAEVIECVQLPYGSKRASLGQGRKFIAAQCVRPLSVVEPTGFAQFSRDRPVPPGF